MKIPTPDEIVKIAVEYKDAWSAMYEESLIDEIYATLNSECVAIASGNWVSVLVPSYKFIGKSVAGKIASKVIGELKDLGYEATLVDDIYNPMIVLISMESRL